MQNKTVWEAPELTELDVTETAGGTKGDHFEVEDYYIAWCPCS
ncbi:MAG TPA: hypothetical protein PLN48_04270 [Lachnospiraceae bacterium]|nr:hypothetical protein [Lachnospiraceae bacterium]